MKITQQNQTDKFNLNNLIKKLSKLIETNTCLLYQTFQTSSLTELDEKMKSKLKEQFAIKKKECDTSKKLLTQFKSQYEMLLLKLNNFNTKEKKGLNNIHPIQNELELIQNENKNLFYQINEIKLRYNKQNKEVENIKLKLKYSKELKEHTNDLNSLSALKFDYYQKLQRNKTILENKKKELNTLEELINNIINNENDFNKNKLHYIQMWVNIIKQDLNGSIVDIIERINQNKTHLSSNNDNKITQKQPQMLNMPNTLNKHRYQRNNNSQIENKNTFIPNLFRNKSNYNSYIKQTNFTTKHAFVLRKSGSSIINDNIHIKNIHKKYSHNSYNELLNKKEYYSEVNNKIENHLANVNKTFKKKVNDLSICVSSNIEKLSYAINDNYNLKNEVHNLNKIYELTKEKNKLNKKLNNATQSKIKKLQKISSQSKFNTINIEQNTLEQNKINSSNNNDINQQYETLNLNDLVFIKPTNMYNNNNNNFSPVMDETSRKSKLNEIKSRYLSIPSEPESFINE